MKLSQNQIEEIISLSKKGMSNRSIASKFKVHHNTIGYWLKANGLKSTFFNEPIDLIDNNSARCKKCKEIKNIDEFQFGRRNSIGEYKYSYCNECRKRQQYLNLNSTIKKYLRDRVNRIKSKSIRDGVNCDLDYDFIDGSWNTQKGKCFYTDIKMTWGVGNGKDPNRVSFDRIDPKKGYTKDNVVLCSNRFNMIKADMSKEELKKYIPSFYNRILLLERTRR